MDRDKYPESEGIPIWVADSETDPFKHGDIPHPFIWGVYNGYDKATPFYREFTGTGPAFAFTKRDTDLFVDYLAEQEIILYAHNGGKFDWHFLSHRFEAGSEILIIHGRIARFKIGKCEFRDSYNLLPIAMEQYQKTKIDYTKMFKEHRAHNMPEIRDYLKSDCVNQWNLVHGFIRDYGLHITQASAAMHYWNRRLGNRVYRSTSTHYDKFKKFYYGGRVQCFEQGDFKVPGKSIDIISAYPCAMLDQHPYGLQYAEFEGKPKCHPKHWGPMFFTVECIAHGCFPYRGNNGSMYYPDDDESRIYDVTGWELIAAVETKTIEQIKFLFHYEYDDLQDFADYIIYFWNLRKQYKKIGDVGAIYYAKIFMNALYGKFATDPRRYRQYTIRHPSELDKVIEGLADGESFRQFREWLIVAQDNEAENKRQFYNIATAASITGSVRAKLWRGICASTRPLYCDTDSITALDFGDATPIGSELGQWEIEHEYDRCVIGGKKLYGFHKSKESYAAEIAKWRKKPPEARGKRPKRWKIASKGARLESRQLIDIAAGKRVIFKNEAPTFSASKSQPTFITRELKMTAQDVRHVPRRFDPKYVKE